MPVTCATLDGPRRVYVFYIRNKQRPALYKMQTSLHACSDKKKLIKLLTG